MTLPIEPGSPGQSPSTADANERLAQSRERLRQAMRLGALAPRGTGASTSLGASGREGTASASATLGLPVIVQVLLEGWSRHPLRTAITLGHCAAKAILQPMANKHPVALMLAALLVGASVAYLRPWRWVVKPGFRTGLLPHLAYKTLSRIPLTMWWSVLGGSSNRHDAAPHNSGSTFKAR